MDIMRGDVVLVNLDPSIGKEIRKTRPCVIISPNELNTHLQTFIVAPMTTGGHAYPFRISCRFQGKNGYIILDQIRTIDIDRIIKIIGRISDHTITNILAVLQDMFRE
jgi:mRNA interferase MazF